MTFQRDALLRSINDRLGGSAGQEIPPLSREYLGELLEFAVANHEDLEADYEERVQEIRQEGDSDLWERLSSG